MTISQLESSATIRLLYAGPAIPGENGIPVAPFGLQSRDKSLLPGRKSPKGVFQFECEITLCKGRNGLFTFTGDYVHGTPDARFLYLSWTNPGSGESAWRQRIKIPLGGLVAEILSSQDATCFEADVTGRLPHSRESIIWLRCAG